MRNHLAVVSACTAGAAAGGVAVAARALSCGIESPRWSRRIDGTDKVDQVADVVLREAVVDPGRHGGALDAVEYRFKETAVGDAFDKRGVAEVARARQDVEGVGALAVGLAAVASGAALDEEAFAIVDGSGDQRDGVLVGHVVG